MRIIFISTVGPFVPRHGINEHQEYSGAGDLDHHDFHFQAPLAKPVHPPLLFEEDHAKNPDGWGGGIIPSFKKRFAPACGP
jgi:hypothetical protein